MAVLLFPAVRSGRPALDLLGLMFLVIFCTSAFVLTVGLLGQLRRGPLVLISVSGLLVIGAIPASRERLLIFRSYLLESGRNLREFWSQLPLFLRLITVLAIAAGAARFTFLIVTLPPFVWDSLTYHLTNVAHWTQTGRIEIFDAPVVRIYTPANYELIAAWFTVFLHHDAFVEAAGLPVYALAGLAVYTSSRSLGSSRTGAWSAALAFAHTPALLIAVTGTKNDPHMTAYFLTAVAILLDLSRRKPITSSLNRLVFLVLVLMLALGTKAYLIFLLPGLVILWIAERGLRRVLGDTLDIIASAAGELKGQTAHFRAVLVGLIVIGVLLAGYWNLRNLALQGNPFYPYGVAVGAAQVLAEGDRTQFVNLDRLTENLATMRVRYLDQIQPVSPDLPNTTGWGWFFYVLGVPAVVWATIRHRALRPITIAFFASFLLLLFTIKPGPFNMRYLIWFPALGALGWSLWADKIVARPRVFAFGFWGLYAICLGLNFSMTVNYGIVSADKFGLMLEQGMWSRQASTLKLNMPSEYENALVEVPEEEVLGYNVHTNGFIYPLYRAGLDQRLVYVPFSADESCETIADRMLELGTQYLFVARDHTSGPKRERIEACGEIGNRFEIVARGVYRARAQG